MAEFEPPGYHVTHLRAAPAGGGEDVANHHRAIHMVTPETETTAHYFWAFSRTYARDEEWVDEALRQAIRKVFQEDVDAIEAQEEMIATDDPDAVEVSVKLDAGGLHGRRLLQELLDAESGLVRYGHRVESVVEGPAGVTVNAETPDGPKVFEAGWVIASDGAHSAVRNSLGLSFEGFTYEDRYLLISTDLEFAKYLPGLCFVNYLADPDEYAMRLRIPDIWRVMVPVAPGVPDEEVRRPDRMRQTVGALVNDAIDWASVRVATYQLYRVDQDDSGPGGAARLAAQRLDDQRGVWDRSAAGKRVKLGAWWWTLTSRPSRAEVRMA